MRGTCPITPSPCAAIVAAAANVAVVGKGGIFVSQSSLSSLELIVRKFSIAVAVHPVLLLTLSVRIGSLLLFDRLRSMSVMRTCLPVCGRSLVRSSRPSDCRYRTKRYVEFPSWSLSPSTSRRDVCRILDLGGGGRNHGGLARARLLSHF